MRQYIDFGLDCILIDSHRRSFQVIDEVLKEAPNADFKFVALDLADEESIRAAGAEVLALDIPIHVSFILERN